MNNGKKDIFSSTVTGSEPAKMRAVLSDIQKMRLSAQRELELARRMRRPLNAINEIINGKKSITAETALQLEEVMPEIPARFWLNLEIDYQLTRALVRKRNKLG